MSIVEKALNLTKSRTDERPGKGQVFGTVVTPVSRDSVVAVLPSVATRIVAINQAALRTAGLRPPEHQERQIANQYRQIKRPIIANAVGRGKPPIEKGQLVMVASAMPGEGKTFTSINLAFSMALEKDVRVVLVDADVAKPQISKMFGIADQQGLLDAVADPAVDVERLIFSTDVPNLSVLSAGTQTDHATELLASARMVEVAEEMARRDPGRIVIFDSPPLLLTTESQVLAHVVGQIIVVVRADRTQQGVLLDALSYLPEGTSASLILNQSVAKGDAGSYYYGYGQDARPPP
jgi:protein-tyrosine kinase